MRSLVTAEGGGRSCRDLLVRKVFRLSTLRWDRDAAEQAPHQERGPRRRPSTQGCSPVRSLEDQDQVRNFLRCVVGPPPPESCTHSYEEPQRLSALWPVVCGHRLSDGGPGRAIRASLDGPRVGSALTRGRRRAGPPSKSGARAGGLRRTSRSSVRMTETPLFSLGCSYSKNL